MDILKYIWQLPQHLVALFMLLFVKYRVYDYYGKKVYISKFKNICFSLGNYIFLSQKRMNETTYLAHEYGHSIQSEILGPIYLLVIGITSAVNPYSGAKRFNNPVEKWANKLGGVEVIITGNRSCDFYLKKS